MAVAVAAFCVKRKGWRTACANRSNRLVSSIGPVHSTRDERRRGELTEGSFETLP